MFLLKAAYFRPGVRKGLTARKYPCGIRSLFPYTILLKGNRYRGPSIRRCPRVCVLGQQFCLSFRDGIRREKHVSEGSFQALSKDE